ISSAICAVLSAAPLRRLSPQTKNSMPCGSSSDSRTRPTQVGSAPTTSAGVGYSPRSGSSFSTTPGAARSVSQALSLLTGLENRACTATECVVITGTRTQVALTRSEGRPRIFRDSLRILSSSDDQPASFSEPAHGTTLSASGAGNGPRSPTAARTSPARAPSAPRPLAELAAGDLLDLGVKRVDARLPRPRGRLVRRDHQFFKPEGTVQRAHGDDQRERGAVRVSDDSLCPPQCVVRVDLGHHKRHRRVHTE